MASLQLFLSVILLTFLPHNQSLKLETSNVTLPDQRFGCISVFDGNDTIYIFSGGHILYPTRDILEYKISTDSITLLDQQYLEDSIFSSENPYGKSADGNRIFIFDHSNSGPGTERLIMVNEFNILSKRMRQVGNIPNGVECIGCPVVQMGDNSRKISIFGNHYESFPGALMHFDTETYEISWTNGTLVEDIYLFSGGWDPVTESAYILGHGDWEENVYVTRYDAGEGIHERVTKLNTTLYGNFASFIANGGIYLVDTLGDIEGSNIGFYDFATEEVKVLEVEGLTGPFMYRSWVYVESVNRFYLFGGFDGTTYSDKIWFIDLNE